MEQLRCFPSPVLFIDMCGARLPSSENRKVLQGGKDEDYGSRERLEEIRELHSQLEPGHAELRAQESVNKKDTGTKKPRPNNLRTYVHNFGNPDHNLWPVRATDFRNFYTPFPLLRTNPSPGFVGKVGVAKRRGSFAFKSQHTTWRLFSALLWLRTRGFTVIEINFYVHSH